MAIGDSVLAGGEWLACISSVCSVLDQADHNNSKWLEARRASWVAIVMFHVVCYCCQPGKERPVEGNSLLVAVFPSVSNALLIDIDRILLKAPDVHQQ